MPADLSRRELLSWLALASLSARASSGRAADEPPPEPKLLDELEMIDLKLEGGRRTPRRARVFVPRARRPDERFPVLVLLHGLGETENEELGVRAWGDRYGLLSADYRLRHPPVVRGRGKYLPDERLAKINARLGDRPYRGFIVACPYTPNVYKEASTAAAVDRYAGWIKETLLPAVRGSTPARGDAASTASDGCSLGGYVALEVFLRAPEEFGAVGGVQTAIGEVPAIMSAARLRKAIDEAGPRAIHIETSIWDPSLKVHELWGARLTELQVPYELDVLPGGHDQIFLREVGTLEMLLWHDRRMPP
jgi:predicted esterase